MNIAIYNGLTNYSDAAREGLKMVGQVYPNDETAKDIANALN